MASAQAWIDDELIDQLHSVVEQQHKLEQQLASLTWARKRLKMIFGNAGEMAAPRSVKVLVCGNGGSFVTLAWHNVIVYCDFEGPDDAHGFHDIVTVMYDNPCRRVNTTFNAYNGGLCQAIHAEIQERLKFVHARKEMGICHEEGRKIQDHYEAEVQRCTSLPQTFVDHRLNDRRRDDAKRQADASVPAT